MSFDFGEFNNWGALKTVAVRPPGEAFMSDAKIDAEWKDLNYHARPDIKKAIKEFSAFENLLRGAGADVVRLPPDKRLTLDAIYTHDALIVTPKGLVKPRMGKTQRRAEADVNAEALAKRNIPIAGEITGEGKIEGGDMIWIDRRNLVVGVGYRTNIEAVLQLQRIVGSETVVHWFDLPHYKGRSDVFHLMSVISPLDKDVALVYRPLMPVRLVEFLERRGMTFIDVPEHEFPTMGCNVLALGPRQAVMVAGNPITELRMKAAGVKVHVIEAENISRLGEGGPTCMTRPLVRG
jgi:N-dimethylarginine dimethylaminohydrolase